MRSGRPSPTLRALARCALAVLLVEACGRSQPVDLVVHNVTVLDVETGGALIGHAVVVSGGVVRDVVPAEEADGFQPEASIDGRGGFLIPALADAHVHLRSASELDNYRRYGVALVINMSGGPHHLGLREAVAEGRLPGPEIVTAGPTLDGARPTNPLFTPVQASTAAQIVGWIADRGYDLVKVYQQMDAETLRAVVRAAEQRGLITTGHVSRIAGVEGALAAGLRYVAHGEELAFESFDEESRRFDRRTVPEIAELVARRGVTVTPMISYLENVPPQVLALDDYLGSDPMARVPAAMKTSFGPRQGWFSNREDPAAFAAQMADAAGFVAELTATLDDRGVALILGTDAGFGGAIPGYGVHQELQSLVRAGLSELAALQSATLNVGRYLQQIDAARTPWGRIEPGHAADLLLLRANPLQEISATLEIEGVALAGRWHGGDELARLDRRIRGRQAALIAAARRFEEALVSGDVEAARELVDSLPTDLHGEPLMAPDSCIFLGYRHYYGGRRQLAGRLYEICAEMHPETAALWLHIGRAREEGGDAAGAIAAYRRALAANPWYGGPADAIRRLERP